MIMQQVLKNYIELIEHLCRAPGLSGFEDEVVRVAAGYAKENDIAETRETNIRNLYLKRRGNTGGKPVVMLDAHTDEVGFMVQAIRPDGCLRFVDVGAMNREKIQGQGMLVRNAEGRYLNALVSSKPPHYAGADSDVCLDVGARTAEEAATVYKIRIGEPVVPASSFIWDQAHGNIFAKALDCRIGCATVLAALEVLAGEELAVDVVGALNTQEEIGGRGAKVAAQTLLPAAAIVFEGSPADDTFNTGFLPQTALKRGPMLRHIDGSMIANPRFMRYALDLAKNNGIEVQEAVRSGSGTNGGVIHQTGEGIPTIVVSIPVRYAHAPLGISAYTDFEGAVRLAVALLRALNAECIAGF
ncbi:MAG: M42 family peptidase [Treponema sp.]|jgi:putative aminopeptidase FrvX|nr:M42 family peptidase [Treponema sp.]